VFNEMLSGECSDPDTCWCWDVDPMFCGCYTGVSSIPCGPDPTRAGLCCYYALLSTDTICEGRPFIVEGLARTAPPAARKDWLAKSCVPDVRGLDRATRRALADAWTEDALAEHASIASFARFVLELLAVGAPAELVRDAQQALADEIVHAELCFTLASTYVGEHVGPGALSVEGAPLRTDLADIACATAREGCINETLAALCARAACEEARDPVVKAALSIIADDEARHAALAWRFVRWAVTRDARARALVRNVFATLPRIDAVAPRVDNEALLTAHGHLAPAARSSILREGLDQVVVPCASALLRESSDAWIASA
jgi:hypothetical protein